MDYANRKKDELPHILLKGANSSLDVSQPITEIYNNGKGVFISTDSRKDIPINTIEQSELEELFKFITHNLPPKNEPFTEREINDIQSSGRVVFTDDDKDGIL